MHASLLVKLQTSETFSFSSCTYTPYKVNAVLTDEFAFLDFLYLKAS